MIADPSSLHDLWLVLHLVAFAVGTGTAMFSDILFVRAIRRPTLGRWNSEVLSVGSAVIWTALVFVLVSGVALTVPRTAELFTSGRFLTKMVVVAVIIANGIRLQRVLTPRLTEAFFRVGATSVGSAMLPTLRRQAFVAGAISTSSWLSAVALGGLPDLPNGLWLYPLCYLVALGGAIGTSLVADLLYGKTLARASQDTAKAVAEQLLEEVDVYKTWFSRPKKRD